MAIPVLDEALAKAERLLRQAIDKLSTSGAGRDLARAHYHLARTLFAKPDRECALTELEASLELRRGPWYDQFMVAEGQGVEGNAGSSGIIPQCRFGRAAASPSSPRRPTSTP